MKEILPHWHFSPNAPVMDVDTKKMTRGDRAVAGACRRAMETEVWKELVILESLGVRFNGLVGRFVSEVAMPVLEVMPGDSFHQGAKAQLSHMVKTRDGGETIRLIKTLAVKGRF
ncbi:hypothetical protein GA607_03750 [Bifidobacterium adolescentis]|nr:hypothetical protein GA606_05310 [Bifidobacterium adolescentis]KAB5920364.1 hypothetical protein GA608_04305 [Bifidobacterium adolescentis]KAB5922881.1 hypothetical protein GA607_03750 [Bifidobacterium adolescentis]KAB5925959.1 hypothetical protein GA605_04315 [Bifidobacterium adolescentis]KAB5927579.1 hypothetical protein GA611_04310 [Bifidobacterium adolescentis]